MRSAGRYGEVSDPQYGHEGKTSLVIAIGCTGGKHRSVALARELHERLKTEAKITD